MEELMLTGYKVTQRRMGKDEICTHKYLEILFTNLPWSWNEPQVTTLFFLIMITTNYLF